MSLSLSPPFSCPLDSVRTSIPTSSFFADLLTLTFIDNNRQQSQVGKGETTLVLFDYELQKTYLVPDDWRKILGPDLPQQGVAKL